MADTSSRYIPSTGTNLSTTSEVAVFTATTGYTNAVAVWFCNNSASIVTVTVKWHDASRNTSFYLASSFPIPGNGIFQLEPPGLGLEVNDEIRVTPSAANVVTCIVMPVVLAGRTT